ncbi:MAG: DNA translocase FtsK 4TM domain-containing protein [Alloprevotella sp.]|nr:DNA translocase FtsK 4TM domain-containing protein [Alloprevotella sp.]
MKAIFTPEGGWRKLLSGETFLFVTGLVLMLVCVFVIISIVSLYSTAAHDQAILEAGGQARNWGGTLGARCADLFVNQYFGICSILIPILGILLSMKLMHTYKVRLWKWFLNLGIIMIWGSVALSLCSQEFFPAELRNVPFKWGGLHGDSVRDLLTSNLGLTGAILVLGLLAILYLIYLSSETVRILKYIITRPKAVADKFKKNAASDEPDADAEEDDGNAGQPEDEDDDDDEGDSEDEEDGKGEDGNEEDEEEASNVVDLGTDFGDEPEAAANPSSLKMDITAEEPAGTAADAPGDFQVEPGAEDEEADGETVADAYEKLPPYDPRKDLEFYKFPSVDLLKKYENADTPIDMEEHTANKDRIVKVLSDFGVKITAIRATVGPTITLYEVTPAAGIRINRIKNLSDDIALALSAIGVRIIAPIPGKGTIGIEVPNRKPKIVSMESLINSRRFQESDYALPIALGKTITNEVFMVDLAKLPHLLVAGATGQGKSVGLNAIVTSLLYKKHPSELKIVMVDPKKVEFSVYSPLENFYLAKTADTEEPIITDPTKVVATLKSLCQLMDHRYDLLKRAKARNIKEYNEKFINRRLNPKHGHEFMPYIVIIIDEFGDLIMTAGKEVELPIARIAQLARAVGMHMVIATQRPTTNIITGTIKANFPARMAFKVSSMIDSRTILDRPGANQLVGRGDMLFLNGNEPVRVQCAFVDTPEVESINEFVSSQQGYLHAYELPEVAVEAEEGGGGMRDAGPLDSMFEEAARLIVIHQQGSTSLIQRKMGLGYNRAGRIMDQMEQMGIVGPSRGAKPREVLIPDEVALNALLEAHM